MDTTIKDIAKKADVSYVTVSRALNNKYGVKPETKEKILKIAKELNYSPNAIARGLVTRKTNTIGLIIPDIKNPFYPEVAGGIEDCANEFGYNIFLCNTNWSKEKEMQYVKLLLERRVDGFIVAPVSHSIEHLDKFIHEKLPVVYVSRAPKETKYNYVVIDNIRGGFLATKHLIEAGHKIIGFIGDISAIEGSFTTDERFEGYKLAFEKYGMKIDERYIKLGDFTQKTAYNIVKKMIEDNDCPQAFFAENDLLALGVIQAVRDMGMRIPEDVAVVGFDDISIASFQGIQLSTIAQPKYSMGRIAFEIFMKSVNSNEAEKVSRKVILEPELIIRETSK